MSAYSNGHLAAAAVSLTEIENCLRTECFEATVQLQNLQTIDLFEAISNIHTVFLELGDNDAHAR